MLPFACGMVSRKTAAIVATMLGPHGTLPFHCHLITLMSPGSHMWLTPWDPSKCKHNQKLEQRLDMVTRLHWLLRALRPPWEQTKLACQRAHEQVNRACWPITQGYIPDRKAMLDHPAPTEPPLTMATGMSPGEIRGRHTTLRPTQALLLNPPCLIKPLDAEAFCYANWEHTLGLSTATAAESLQSCPCNP